MNRNPLKPIKNWRTFFICLVTFLLNDLAKSAEETNAVYLRSRTFSSSLDRLFFDEDPLVSNNVASFLSSADKAQMRLTAKRYRDYFDLTFFGSVDDPHLEVIPFSSETSEGTIGTNIMSLLGSAQRRVIIASDKCTNEEFLDDLLSLRKSPPAFWEIRIVTGEDPQTRKTLGQPKYTGVITHQAIPSNKDRSGKMHNKFIVVDESFVITGSPNLTFAAYNYNIESFVAIYHRFVAKLYLRYYEYIVSGKDKYDPTQPEYRRVRKMLEVFNSAPENPIQVCLAPILNIKDFIIRELDTSQVININMFLVSRGSSPEDDIITYLLTAMKNGTGITVKVDGNQYHGDAGDYMPQALAPLRTRGAEVYTVVKRSEKIKTKTKEIDTKPQFHDKLILIQQADDLKKVFIGSAGLTSNVQDNLNLENMVLLKIPSIFDELLNHFNAINSSRRNLEIVRL